MKSKYKFNEMTKHFGILIIYLVIALLIARFPDEEPLMKWAYGVPATNVTINPSILLDKSSVPMVNYGDKIGLQRNPLTVANFALQYYNNYVKYGNDTARKAFLNNTNWLLDNSASHGNLITSPHRLTYPPYSLVNRTISVGNYSILEYKFTHPLFGLAPPWRSALAQSEALPVLARAYDITGNGKYLDLAKMLLNSFFVEVRNGGVTYKTPTNGWWYEEVAGNKSTESGILSGMMYTVLGIHNYYNLTKNPTAKYLFDEGVLALAKNMSRYDYKNGTSSYNDLQGHVASSARLQSNVNLLGQLYDLTKQTVFKLYHDKWENSLSREQGVLHNPSLLLREKNSTS